MISRPPLPLAALRQQTGERLLLITTLLTLAPPSLADEPLGRLILSPGERERLQRIERGGPPGPGAAPRQLTGALSRRGIPLNRWHRDPDSGEILEARPLPKLPAGSGGEPATPVRKSRRPLAAGPSPTGHGTLP